MSAHDHRTLRKQTENSRPSAGSFVAGCLGVAGIAVAGHTLPALAPHLPVLCGPLGIEDHTADGEGYALTFDDGPHREGTPAVLQILAATHTPATFFLVGEQVRRDPALAREILSAGHTVGLHCDRHRNLLRLTHAQTRADIDRAQATIEDATGAAIGLYRPPYGAISPAALRLARARAWRTLLWSQWGRDWEKRATPESIARRVTDGAGPGAVLLLHDADDYSAPGSWRSMVAALPRVLDTLAQRGLRPVAP
jgi:peptidoglycan/xylan/chitin deacetylase (PgdA/CDA1 family)